MTVRSAHCPGAPVSSLVVSLQRYMDKIRFQQKEARESAAAACVWAQLCSHLLSSSGAQNDSRGKETGSRKEREGGCVCVCLCCRGVGRGSGGWWQERQEMRINTELGTLGNGIFKGVSGSFLKVESFQQGVLS